MYLPLPLYVPYRNQNVVVVVVFTLKTVVTSIQYLLFITLQGKETNFRGHKLTQNEVQKNKKYKGSGRGGLPAPPSSVVGNALVVIDDGIESVNVKNRYQGARVSARRANREPEDGIRWKFVHGGVVIVR